LSNNTQRIFAVAPIIFLLAIASPGQPGSNFQLIARHDIVFHGREFPSSTFPQVNKAQNALTFSGSRIHIVALAGPEEAMFSYRIAGLTNPTLRVPVGARIHLTVVNIDDDMFHDLVISLPHRYFPVHPEIPPQAVRTHPLPARHDETFQAEVLVIQALRPGSFDYFCSIPGHAKGGMHGRLEVLQDARVKSHSGASHRLTKEGEIHE